MSEAALVGRRRAWVGMLSLAWAAAGCATAGPPTPTEAPTAAADGRDDVDLQVDALGLQREEGWDVGRPGAALAFAGATPADSAGGASWQAAMTDLARMLAPASPALQPYYVPTLFEALTGAGGERLRAQMRPVHTRAMDEDFARGVALGRQFAAVGWPRDTALIVDAPGPRAVAVAAALADHFTPVLTFGDWPHPLGVVPAHQTLAAILYYLPRFMAAQAARPAEAPPLFVLDANRLAPYRSADTQFDNRYTVRLPPPGELAALGVRHVLYVGADGGPELDDVNAPLVALCRQGLDVKMVALADFVRGGDALAAAAAAQPGDAGDDGDGDESEEEGGVAWFAPWPEWMLAAWLSPPPFWYRGCPWDPGLFWHDYGWYPPPRIAVRPPSRGPVVIGPPKVRRALPASRAVAWVARPRPNLALRVGAPPGRSTGIGQVAVRASRVDGHVTGLRPGGSGSFARRPPYLPPARGVAAHRAFGRVAWPLGSHRVWHEVPGGGARGGDAGRPTAASSSWHAPSRNSAWRAPSSNGAWHAPSSNGAWHAPSFGGTHTAWHATGGGWHAPASHQAWHSSASFGGASHAAVSHGSLGGSWGHSASHTSVSRGR